MWNSLVLVIFSSESLYVSALTGAASARAAARAAAERAKDRIEPRCMASSLKARNDFNARRAYAIAYTSASMILGLYLVNCGLVHRKGLDVQRDFRVPIGRRLRKLAPALTSVDLSMEWQSCYR